MTIILTFLFRKTGNVFVCSCPSFTDLNGYGPTEEAAKNNLFEAIVILDKTIREQVTIPEDAIVINYTLTEVS